MKKRYIIVFIGLTTQLYFCAKPGLENRSESNSKLNQKSGETIEIVKVENAQAMNDSLSMFYNNTGLEYFMKGDSDEALRLFDLAIEHNKYNISPYHNKFQILISNEDYYETLKLMKSLEEVDGDYYPTLTHIGILSEKLNKRKDAVACYQKSLNLINQQIDSDEADLNLFTDKITVLKLLNRNDDADKISDSLLVVYPDFHELILEIKNSSREDLLEAY